MFTVKTIVDYFEEKVPTEMKSDGDNVGLLVGICETQVTKALVALDITDEVIDEAISEGAQIILSHHPLFFEMKNIRDDSVNGRKILKLAKNGISALCQHTNLDQVPGGVNDTLAGKLGIKVEGSLSPSLIAKNGESYGMGRFGTLSKPKTMEEFLPFVKSALSTDGLRFHDAGRDVRKVGVVGGTGGSYISAAISKGCDTLVTADIKHSDFLTAKALGLNIIDGGHYDTENVIVPVLAGMLKEAFPEIEIVISKAACAPAVFYLG